MDQLEAGAVNEISMLTDPTRGPIIAALIASKGAKAFDIVSSFCGVLPPGVEDRERVPRHHLLARSENFRKITKSCKQI
jgi:hypothetical protein